MASDFPPTLLVTLVFGHPACHWPMASPCAAWSPVHPPEPQGCSWGLPMLILWGTSTSAAWHKAFHPTRAVCLHIPFRRRCKRLAVFLRGLYITFSVGFILLPSSFGLWAAGIFIQSCKLMLCAACGVKPVSRQKLCWSSGSGKWAVSQQ